MTQQQVKRLAVLTNSEANCYQECARKRKMKYRDLRRPIKVAGALHFGTVMHLCLEAMARGENWADAIMGLLEDPYEQAKLEAMLFVHEARYAGDQDFEYVEVEKELGCPVVNPATGAASRTYTYRGKLDAIVRALVSNWVCDHKSTSNDVSPGSPHLEQLKMRAQGYRYTMAARANGYDVKGVVYNVLRKPRITPLLATPLEKRRFNKDGSPHGSTRFEDESVEVYRERVVDKMTQDIDAYLARVFVPISDDDLLDAQFDLWSVCKTIMEADKHDRHPRNPDACFKWGRPCEYWDVCIGRADLWDDAIYRTAKRQHEELAE